MKLAIKQPSSFIVFSAFFLAAVLLSASTAVADVRQDAEIAVSNLRRNTAAQKFSDDMKSLDLVFEVAKRYFSNNNIETADRFYLLTLQKSQIIESMLKASEVVSLPGVLEVTTAPEPKLPAEPVAVEISEEPNSRRIVGTKGVYTVVKADTVRLVAAKLGVSSQHIRSMNGLDAKAALKVGQKLAYNNRKIVPQQIRDGIIVNIPDRTLYYFQQGVLVTSLPVAVGSPTKNEKYVWQTPVGKFKITAKMKDPTWTVPPSIQTEMEEQGKEIFDSVPPGPENPLGKYAIRTSIPGILLHSTTKPSSIYSFSSHGCIRLSPTQMESFFPKVKVNTRGEIIYKPVKLAVTEDGRIFLEVHHDAYKKSTNLVAEARQMVEKQKLTELIDWEKFKSVVNLKNGVAEDITLKVSGATGPLAKLGETTPRPYVAAIVN
ncbi:MAG: L,D-transpeptidase family protein [Geobacteraceae bacterium]|nr:L,D-transpeptidase family protein [Geobacteraceae bacterium]